MSFDPQKNAGRIQLTCQNAKGCVYTGGELLSIAEYLHSNPNAKEKEIADYVGIDPGHHSSGVGDLKRLIKSIWDIAQHTSHHKKGA